MSDTEKMAPTASIEAVMVVRPYKVRNPLALLYFIVIINVKRFNETVTEDTKRPLLLITKFRMCTR
jgi:hypothetical protein